MTPQYHGAQVSILLVEDNVVNQQVALGFLGRLGLKADIASDGFEALKMLDVTPYDLVLMDVQMPRLDGLEATRILRTRGLERPEALNVRTPIIAMTAHAMQGDRERCLAAGMDDYLTKPLTPRALLQALGKWLPKTLQAGDGALPRVPAAPAAPTATPVWDREALLGRVLGDEVLAHTIVEAFLEDIPQRIHALEDMLGSGQAMDVARQLHTLKGALATVGAEACRLVAVRMEELAREGELGGVQAQMGDLHAAFAQLKKIMEDA